MVKQQHVDWLLEGVDAWNERRRSSAFRPDFIGLAFRELFHGDLSASAPDWAQTLLPKPDGSIDDIFRAFDAGINLANDMMETAAIDSPGSDLDERHPNDDASAQSREIDEQTRAKLPFPIELTGIDFKFARLSGSHLSNADLRGADLRRADLTDATLRIADLRGANLEGCDLRGAIMWNVDLRGANLAGALLEGSELWWADLIGTDLEKADLRGADLRGAQPWTAKLYPSANQNPRQYDLARLPASKIASVEDMLRIVRGIDALYDDEVVIYFRGEALGSWQLTPSVMRQGYAAFESDMLLDLASKRPEEFNETSTALEQWVLAQHHELKTRFLDITRNPLVALFFACCDPVHAEDDGMLHVFVVPKDLVKRFNSDTVAVIANLAKLTKGEQDLLLGKLTETEPRSHEQAIATISDRVRRLTGHGVSRVREAMDRLYQLIQDEKPHFRDQIDIRDLYRVMVIEPQHSPERIRAQSAAFLASAFHQRFEREEVLRWNENLPVYAHYSVPIMGEAKGTIAKDLQLLGFTRETLFPSLDESAKAVADAYQKRASELAE